MAESVEHTREDEARLGAYVLHALPSAEDEVFDVHAQACDACRTQLEMMRWAIGEVAKDLPVVEASPAIRERVLASAAAAPQAERLPDPVIAASAKPAPQAEKNDDTMNLLLWAALVVVVGLFLMYSISR